MRFIPAILAILVGLGFAVCDIAGGAPLSAAAFALCGLLAAAALTFGFAVRKEPFWELGAGICGALFVAHVFFETPGFDTERQQLQIDIFSAMATPSVLDGNAWKLSQEERKIAVATMLECATQGNNDLLQSAIEANGAVHLGPEASLVDASVQALDGKTPPERCLSGFKTLYKSHPLIFFGIANKHHVWMEKHGIPTS